MKHYSYRNYLDLIVRDKVDTFAEFLEVPVEIYSHDGTADIYCDGDHILSVEVDL